MVVQLGNNAPVAAAYEKGTATALSLYAMNPDTPPPPPNSRPDPQTVLRELRTRAERRQLVTQEVSPETAPKVQRLIQELQVHQIELEMQYEELLLAQAEVEASRAQYLDLYEFAPVGYCTLTSPDTVRQLNLHMAQLLGTVRQQLLNRRLGLFVDLADRARFADFVQQLYRSGERNTITLAMRRHDGQLLYARLDGTLTRNDYLEPQLRLALTDVTEQYQTNQALALSEKRFRTLFDRNQDGMVLLRDNRFIDCNQATLNLLGLRHKNELLGRHAAAFSPERQANRQLSVGLADTYWEQTLSRGYCRFEWCRLRADGEEFWEDILQTAIPEAGGTIIHATWRDITAEKQAATLLRQSEQRFRHALDASALGVIDWDLTNDTLYWDERAQAIFGLPYSTGSTPSAAAISRVHPADQARLLQLIRDVQPGQTALEVEYRVLRPDGSEAHVTMTGQVNVDHNQQNGRLLGLIRDVTERRVTEQELSYKNRLLQHILGHMPVLLGRLSPEGRYLELSGAGLRRLHLADNELAGKSIFDVFPTLAEPTRRLLAGEEVNFLGAAEQEGEQVYFQSYGFFDAERAQGIVFAIDVTDSEQRREQLRKEQQFTQNLLDSSIDCIVALDATLRVTAWNCQAARFTGICAANALGKHLFTLLPALEQDSIFQGLLQQALAGQVAQYLSWPGRYFPGPLDLNLLPLTATCAPHGVLLLARDVTQRQQLLAETTRLKLREQQVVLSAILTTQEEERRRIAEALHNGVGQLLYATSLHLDQLPASEPQKSSKHLLSEAIKATRSISFELTPGILEDFGLVMALRELHKRIPAASLRVNMHLEGLEDELPATLQTAIYRIVQELLNNVMRHAEAQEAFVSVVHTNHAVKVRVQDDGKGFDPSRHRNGIGLSGIRNRVKLLGGQLQLSSQPGQGTTIGLLVPVVYPEPA